MLGMPSQVVAAVLAVSASAPKFAPFEPDVERKAVQRGGEKRRQEEREHRDEPLEGVGAACRRGATRWTHRGGLEPREFRAVRVGGQSGRTLIAITGDTPSCQKYAPRTWNTAAQFASGQPYAIARYSTAWSGWSQPLWGSPVAARWRNSKAATPPASASGCMRPVRIPSARNRGSDPTSISTQCPSAMRYDRASPRPRQRTHRGTARTNQ